VRGQFGHVEGQITIDGTDVTRSSVRVNIDVSAINAGESALDADLKGAGFLDIEHFPSATFVSTSVARAMQKTLKSQEI
jgi:polyisoprenoid-binding protein YceI